MPTNPYANPYPVKQPSFLFGRERFVNGLVGRLLSADYQVSQQIVGLTRSGKTSILNCIARLGDKGDRAHVLAHFGLDSSQLVDLDRVLFVQTDCTGMSANTESAFWTLLGRQLVRTIEQSRHDLLATVNAGTSQTFDDVYLSLRELARHQMLVVFLFDEFDRVLASLPDMVLDNLRFFPGDLSGQIIYIAATRRKWSKYYDITRSTYDIQHENVTSWAAVYLDSSGYVGLLEKEGIEGFIRSIAEDYECTFMIKM